MKKIFLSDYSTNAVTFTKIEGSQSITTQNAGIRVQYNGSGYKNNWHILMKKFLSILLWVIPIAGFSQTPGSNPFYKMLAEGGRRVFIQDSLAQEYDSAVLRSVAAYGMFANVYDTRGKFLNLYKKLLAGSNISGTTVSRGKVRLRFAGFGDSVGGYAFNPFADLLYDMFGWGGGILSLSASTGGGSAHSNTSETTYWFNGNWFEINGTGSLTFLYGGGRVQATQLKIYYIKESGAGSFQVQIDAGAGYVNEGSVVDCNNATLVSDVITINKSVGTYGVRINQVSGNVKVIMVVGINEPTDYDGVTMLQLNVGGLGWTAANATSKAITRPVFADLAIDLAFLEFKETGSIYSTFKQWADSFKAASPNTDWVLIGSTPQATNNADNIADNSALRLVAYQNNWFYYNGYSPFISYAKMDSLDWEGDGLHPDYATGFYKSQQLWRIIGISDILKLNRSWGVTYNGDQIFFRNRGLQFGGSNDNTYQGRIAGSTSSPDLYVYLKRWFSLLSTAGSTYTHFDPNTGWLLDANQTGRGYGWNSNGIMMKANDSLIDFWRATNRTYKMNIHARTGMFDSLYVGTGLGTTGIFPSSSAIVEFNSTTKGLLIPRMTAAQRLAISSPNTGLLVYDTDSSRIMQRTSSAWRGYGFTDETGGGVTSITGTANQVITSASTGAITLSTPQNIHTGASPQFSSLGINSSAASGIGLFVGGSISNALSGVSFNPTLNLSSSVSSTGISVIGGTMVEPSSGSITDLSSLIVRAPTITPGAATVGSAYTLQIDGEPTATVTDVNGVGGLWVKNGSTRLDGSIIMPITTATGNSTLDKSNYTVLGDASGGSLTISLPSAASCTGIIYVIKKIDGSINSITIDPNGSETIDGSSTLSITAQWNKYTIQSTGSNWVLL